MQLPVHQETCQEAWEFVSLLPSVEKLGRGHDSSNHSSGIQGRLEAAEPSKSGLCPQGGRSTL